MRRVSSSVPTERLQLPIDAETDGLYGFRAVFPLNGFNFHGWSLRSRPRVSSSVPTERLQLPQHFFPRGNNEFRAVFPLNGFSFKARWFNATGDVFRAVFPLNGFSFQPGPGNPNCEFRAVFPLNGFSFSNNESAMKKSFEQCSH